MTALTDIRKEAASPGVQVFGRNWSKRLLLRLLSRLQYGRLTIVDGDEQYVFGNEEALAATITVHDREAYRHALFGGSIGGGESYVRGSWSVDDLTTLIRIMVLNMDIVDRMEGGFAWLLRPFHMLRHVLRQNSRQKARENILAHYDLGNELYEAFLDPTMMYSAAIYPEPDSSLETGSVNKLDRICRKLDLGPADHVIEIGTGWGGFAIHAASKYGCRVTTTTISEAQYTEAAKRIEQAGLGERITLLNKDYRDLRGQYSKLVSIEMIEAVGHKYLPAFMEKCGSLLRPDGMLLLQAITVADQKYENYVRTVDFIQRHIFPGGCLPSNNRMLELISAKTDMVVRSIDDFGFDYARTLRDWRIRFLESFESLRQYGFDERFKRLWEFYLCYCEGGFLERSISVVHLTATRPMNRMRRNLTQGS